MEGNLQFKKLPSAVLPTVSGADAVIAEKSDGTLWHIDSNGSSQVAKQATVDQSFNELSDRINLKVSKAGDVMSGKLGVPIINGVFDAILSSTTFTATVGSGITSITAGDKITIRINSNIAANTAYTFRIYNGTSYLASGSIYWNTGTSYTATAHRAYYGNATLGAVLELVYNGSYWFVVGGNESEAYPVGSIYMTINSTSPASLFGGSWTQITNDAYLKIVTSNAGSVGGTSSGHTIPTTSMPSHNHAIKNYQPSAYTITGEGVNNGLINQSSGQGVTWGSIIEYTGGGQAYYPYYYGVYVWRRTA